MDSFQQLNLFVEETIQQSLPEAIPSSDSTDTGASERDATPVNTERHLGFTTKGFCVVS
uniref:Phb1.2.42 n=1 Tax=Coprinopsis cinerea TaxID=5346 RepID=Q9UVN0_COPCI|nr:Phb1.2.42 [Coprinopsis cinerea]